MESEPITVMLLLKYNNVFFANFRVISVKASVPFFFIIFATLLVFQWKLLRFLRDTESVRSQNILFSLCFPRINNNINAKLTTAFIRRNQRHAFISHEITRNY